MSDHDRPPDDSIGPPTPDYARTARYLDGLGVPAPLGESRIGADGPAARSAARIRAEAEAKRPGETRVDENDPLGTGDPYVACSHCGGEGLCDDGSDPLGDCPDEYHPCHACGGSGDGKDQVIF